MDHGARSHSSVYLYVPWALSHLDDSSDSVRTMEQKEGCAARCFIMTLGFGHDGKRNFSPTNSDNLLSTMIVMTC